MAGDAFLSVTAWPTVIAGRGSLAKKPGAPFPWVYEPCQDRDGNPDWTHLSNWGEDDLFAIMEQFRAIDRVEIGPGAGFDDVGAGAFAGTIRRRRNQLLGHFAQ